MSIRNGVRSDPRSNPNPDPTNEHNARTDVEVGSGCLLPQGQTCRGAAGFAQFADDSRPDAASRSGNTHSGHEFTSAVEVTRRARKHTDAEEATA